MQARSKIPQKQRWKTIFWVIMMSGWVFSVILVSQIAVVLAFYWIFGKESLNTPVMNAIASIISYIIALAVIFLIPRKCRDKKPIGLRGLPTWTDVGLAPVGFVAALVLGAVLVWIFGAIFPWFNTGEAQDLGFPTYMSGGDRIIAFLLLAIVAPIAEEVIFRGFLYGKLREKIATPLAIFITSLVFGLAHMQWNVGVNVFALSVVACVLRELTGTIYAGILTHIIKNAVAFYLLYVIGM